MKSKCKEPGGSENTNPGNGIAKLLIPIFKTVYPRHPYIAISTVIVILASYSIAPHFFPNSKSRHTHAPQAVGTSKAEAEGATSTKLSSAYSCRNYNSGTW